jgi:hypothetical protein
MTSPRVFASIVVMGLAGLCQCSLFFDLGGLDNANGDDATTMDAADDSDGGVGALDAASDSEGSVVVDDAADGGGDAGKRDAGGVGVDADAGGLDATDGAGRETGGLDASNDGGGDAGASDGSEGGGPDAGGGDAADSGDPLAVGLLAFYPFDETSGTTSADATGNGHTATMVGGASFAAGLRGNAATLGGSPQSVSLPSGIVSGLTSFSISTWVKLTGGSDGGLPAWSRIFDFGTGITTYMFLTPNNGATGTLRFAITTGGNNMEQVLSNASSLPTATWQHVAVTLTANMGTLYVNGAQVVQNAAMTLNPSSLGNTTQNWLGRSQFMNDPYVIGQIDNFRIYNRALSASEVQQLFQQQQ